ncbi:MAG: hypothetical protein HOJ13_02860 [Nitrospina sp.]|nr:hypothetical protein [Nitrospina sp.]
MPEFKKHFRVKNFEKYQPKRNGKHAPWIRLYHTWNLDPAIGQLCDSHKAHWLGLVCIAHATDNKIPWDSAWIKKRGCFNSNVKLDIFVNLGLIEILCNTDEMGGELKKPLERKKEKEKKKYIPDENFVDPVLENFEQDWKAYPRKDGVKSKALSCYKKSVGDNPEKRQAFLEKMRVYVASVKDHNFLKHAETFFRNWEGLEVSEQIASPIKKQSTVSRNLELIKNIDLGEENDNRRIQAGGSDNVSIRNIRKLGA